jgi:hypothetical protein
MSRLKGLLRRAEGKEGPDHDREKEREKERAKRTRRA